MHLEHPPGSPWQTLSVKEVYNNNWIQVTHREVLNPAGNPGIYGVVHFKNLALGIVPLDDQLHTWLVGQYRYALGQYSWEIPEGGGPLGTSPLEAAQRELLEETGIRARHWTKILDMHISNSVTDEAAMAFVARELEFGAATPEDTEQLQVRRLPLAEAVEMVVQGTITDALSVAALLKVELLLRRGALR
ncbi:MAG TPA: NUDIX hydrolase [Saprospiraceae bacterium]|nr:NUDIX hydrolase [Saprospiraceae bacterium]HMP24090.1 NUDIX hydrolase [Saprospiraceae bacterium]